MRDRDARITEKVRLFATGCRAALACAAAAGCLAIPSAVEAGGLWMPGVGVAPLGRGGAVVASSEDPNAIWYNPANLAVIDGHEITFDVTMIDLSFSFQRADETTRSGDTRSFDEVSNEAIPQFSPRLLFSSDLGTDQFAIGAGVYAPYAPKYRWAEDGAQRYSSIDGSQNILLYQHLAFAWRPHEKIAIGAGIQNMMAVLDQVVAGSSYVGLWGEPQDQDLDLLIRFKAQDLLTITGNAGIWSEPVEGLKIGASVQFPATVLDEAAEVDVRLPTHYAFDNAEFEGDTLKFELELPWIIRAGVSYGTENVFDVEVNVTYETWSVHDKIRTSPDDIRVTGVPTVGEIEVGELDIDRNLQDILGVSIGGDWHVIPEVLQLRFGFMFEQGATPDSTYSVFQSDSTKLAPTLGLSWHTGGLRLDLAYSFMYELPRDISDSQAVQINPAYEDGAVAVGNGRYESFANLLGLGMRYAF